MPNLQEYVAAYVAQLTGPNGESAWHSLVEAGPSALPHLAAALSAADQPRVKASLVRVISEYRAAESVPLLTDLLSDRDAETWKAALDGLVMVGGEEALGALEFAKATAAPDRREWIDEGMRQILETRRPD